MKVSDNQKASTAGCDASCESSWSSSPGRILPFNSKPLLPFCLRARMNNPATAYFARAGNLKHMGAYERYFAKNTFLEKQQTSGKTKSSTSSCKKIFMSFRGGTNMLVKCLHIFTLGLIFRMILTTVVCTCGCCCVSAQEQLAVVSR